jgi:hypothetical protein
LSKEGREGQEQARLEELPLLFGVLQLESPAQNKKAESHMKIVAKYPIIDYDYYSKGLKLV